jgi:hypothetical protein
MSDIASLFAATEQKYGLPPGILAATAQVESHGNPNAVSPKGALGLMQLMPTTAKSLGVDPHDPVQAVDGAGRVWAQNLKATGGDIDAAAMMYDAGPDRSKWNNPETQAYPAKLAAALGPSGQQLQPKGGDPIEAALSGGTSSPQQNPSAQADPNDPIETALASGKGARDASVPNGPVVHAAGNGGAQGNNGNNSVPDNGAGRNAVGAPQGAQGGPAGASASGLQQNSLEQAGNWVNGVSNAALNGFSAGLVKPLDAALDTIIPNAVNGQKTATVWDGGSIGDAFHRNLALERGQFNQFRSDHPGASIGGDILGAFASPFNKLFAPAEGAGFLRSIPNFSAQAGAYGLTRGYSDTGDPKTAAMDAALGIGLGPAGALAGNVVGKAFGAALRARSTFLNAIPQSERSAAAAMIDAGASADQVVAEHPNLNPDQVAAWVGYRARGGKAPVSFSDVPPSEAPSDEAAPKPSPEQYAAALGAQGSRRGVEAVSNVPPQVAADAQRLTQAGVPPEEAQREADILYVGGKPTVAAVTRDPAEQWAFNEGAKDTSNPSGQALNDVQATNNQALHDTITGTVDKLGGVPAQGEAAETAAQTLAQASDKERAAVTAKYNAARAQDGDVNINTDALRELLQSPEMATPTNPQIQQLSNGIMSFLKATDQRAGTTLRSPEEIEQIRQLANSAYDPMGGPVNGAVGKIGGALNDSLDQLDQASELWRAARAAHRQWASQYSDPAGVAQLIARDANGNFLNADRWRLSENGIVSRLDDKPFAQVVGQLKAIGANDALNRLKAGIVQNAYEKATNTARDKLGNPIVNGKLFQAELNRIGMPKLQALMSPDEIAHLATIGRAARALNEPVPGTVNTSNTSAALTRSSLADALKATPGSHPLMKALRATKYVSAGAGHLHAAVVLHGAEHLTGGAAQRAVSQGVKEQLNPAVARAMAAKSTTRINNAQFRAAIGRALRNRGAVPAADNDRGKALGRRLRDAF